MTERDPLEEELLAFLPREPSAELKQRIGDQLDSMPVAEPSRQVRRFRWVGALAGGVLALVLALVLWRASEPKTEMEKPSVLVQPLVDAPFDDALPSVWAYRSAFNQSPEALDDLLDKHAIRIPERETKSERAPDYVFVRFDTKLDALTGEL